MKLKKGDIAPKFTLYTDSDGVIPQEYLQNQVYVIYFYPQDDTETCTKQACDFRDNMSELVQLGVKVIGVSPDTVESHAKFRDKYSLNFILASDTDHQIAESYGAWGKKQLYGKEVTGIIRSTFLVDCDGNIEESWYNVKTPGHLDRVKKAVKAII